MSPELKNLLEVIAEWGAVSFFGSMLWQILRYFSKVTESIQKLNENIAVVIERIEGHEKRIDNLERREPRARH